APPICPLSLHDALPISSQRRAVIVVGSAIILLSLLTYVSAQFQGAGKAFAETFDMPFGPALLLGAGIVIFYTLLGGFWAASLTRSEEHTSELQSRENLV